MRSFRFGRVILIAFGYYFVVALAQNIAFRDEYDNNRDFQDISFNDPLNIPETLLIRMRNIYNVTDFMRQFIVNGTIIPLPAASPGIINGSIPGFINGSIPGFINGRTALSGGGVSALSPFAEPANCQPEEHVVELEKPNNQAILLYPSCVRVKRCGGCCPSKMLTCKPTATSSINFVVLQVRYNPQIPNTFEDQGIRTFTLEQHDQCACDCQEKPSDCTPEIHEYKENECRCVCLNQEQAQKCKGTKKIWDNRNCLCKCRQVQPCSTGRYYSMQKCRCEALRNALVMNGLENFNVSRNYTL